MHTERVLKLAKSEARELGFKSIEFIYSAASSEYAISVTRHSHHHLCMQGGHRASWGRNTNIQHHMKVKCN